MVVVPAAVAGSLFCIIFIIRIGAPARIRPALQLSRCGVLAAGVFEKLGLTICQPILRSLFRCRPGAMRLTILQPLPRALFGGWPEAMRLTILQPLPRALFGGWPGAMRFMIFQPLLGTRVSGRRVRDLCDRLLPLIALLRLLTDAPFVDRVQLAA